jgi:hypothetical protein
MRAGELISGEADKLASLKIAYPNYCWGCQALQVAAPEHH